MFHDSTKGSVRFRKKPKSSQLPSLSNLDPPCCISITTGPIAENQLLHQLLQQINFGAMLMGLPQGHRIWGEAVGCQVSRDEVVTWIQTCFLFDKVGWRCEFYCRIFGYGGGHCFGNLTKKPDAACSLEAGKAAHDPY